MIKKRLLFLFIFASLIVCRPASEREVCEIEFKSTKAASLCGGASFVLLAGYRFLTEEDRNKRINVILLECIRLYIEKEKCKREGWDDPTIY